MGRPSGTSAVAAPASTSRAADIQKRIFGSAVTYRARTPVRRGPTASPPTLAMVATIWARRVGGAYGPASRSARWAVPAATAAPRAIPVGTRPTKSAGSDVDEAKTRDATTAVSTAGRSTVRRPYQ